MPEIMKKLRYPLDQRQGEELVKVNEQDDKLLSAAYEGNMDKVKEALAAGANVNSYDGYLDVKSRGPSWSSISGSSSPLEAAAFAGKLDVVKFLIDNGANPNSRLGNESDYQTALMFAALGGNLDVVKYLVEKGADVNAKAEVYGYETPILDAIISNHEDVALFLLSVGAVIPDVTDLEDKYGVNQEKAVKMIEKLRSKVRKNVSGEIEYAPGGIKVQEAAERFRTAATGAPRGGKSRRRQRQKQKQKQKKMTRRRKTRGNKKGV